jgi:uncharacterized protein (DUF983 family)
MFWKKGSKTYGIVHMKCPRCHEGDLYETPTFSFRKTFDMHKNCPHCGQKYVLESGFYWGAMYVAYALSGGYMLGGFAVMFFLLGIDPYWSLGILTVGAFGLYGWFFRMARSIWLSAFVRFNKQFSDKKTPLAVAE